MHRPISMNRFGVKEDVRGAIGISRGMCSCGRRDHLFDILDTRYRFEAPAGFYLDVRHFNGEPHPPVSPALTLLVEPDDS